MKKRFFALGLSILLLVACSSTDTAQESPVVVEPAKSSTQETESSEIPEIIDTTEDALKTAEILSSIVDPTKLVDDNGKPYQVPANVSDYTGKYVKTVIRVSKDGNGNVTKIDMAGMEYTIVHPNGVYELLMIPYGVDGKVNTFYFDENDEVQSADNLMIEYQDKHYYPIVSDKNKLYYNQGVLVERFGKLHGLPLFMVGSGWFYVDAKGQPDYSASFFASEDDYNLEKQLEIIDVVSEYKIRTESENSTFDFEANELWGVPSDKRLVNSFDVNVENFFFKFGLDNLTKTKLNHTLQSSFNRDGKYYGNNYEIAKLPESDYNRIYDKKGDKFEADRGYIVKDNVGNVVFAVVANATDNLYSRVKYNSDMEAPLILDN